MYAFLVKTFVITFIILWFIRLATFIAELIHELPDAVDLWLFERKLDREAKKSGKQHKPGKDAGM